MAPGPKQHKRENSHMDYYAGIDVSLELSSVCIVDAAGKVVKESKVETHPDALVKFFKNLGARTGALRASIPV